MDIFDCSILLHCFNESVQLLQRFFVVVVAALILSRFEWLRQALRGAELAFKNRILAVLIFGLLAIFGTHSGILATTQGDFWAIDLSANLPGKLKDTQTIVGFSDTIALAAGLIGGPWVGFGAGLIAGAERFLFGGPAGLASSLAMLSFGLYGGGIRHYRSNWISCKTGVFWIAVTATLLHLAMIMLFTGPFDEAYSLAKGIAVPVGFVNTLGCVLFFWIMRDLDRDRLEKETQETKLLLLQAELRTFRAQVDPHFLNNTLNDLSALIRANPDKARSYVVKLADFFKYTREFSTLVSINLEQELAQLQRFLDLQRLGLDDKLQDNFEIDEKLLKYHVIPGCLLALVENALKHGFRGRPAPYQIVISAKEQGNQLILQVKDNGRGIATDRLPILGKQAVLSQNRGGGVALHHLNQSLHLVFGERAELSFESVAEQYTLATLTQPEWIAP